MRKQWLWAIGGVVLAGALALAIIALRTPSEPPTAGKPTGFRRLNEAQYARSIEHIFGSGIRIPGRFEPPLRDEGLLAIGDSKVIVTPSGMEQYVLRAREIAAQVLAEPRRQRALTCMPSSTFDETCARAFLSRYGRLLFRRPLLDEELASVFATARHAAQQTGSFAQGLKHGLAQLLISPYFIFRVEVSEPDPEHPGAQRLDAYSLAARLSFLLWNAPPDDALMDAAASGALHEQDELERQVDRMIASPKFANGVRAFFSDMLGFEHFDALSKDQEIYPKYSSQLASDAKEQILRTIVHVLVDGQGDYRELLTTKETFVNRNIAALYRMPVAAQGVRDWTLLRFGNDEPRAGLLTMPGFLMLDPTHEGRSSPTNRGKAIRELLLCQRVPEPPPNVDFTVVQDTNNPVYKTARQRLTAHRTDPTCAGCHAITDPIGLSFEHYDGIGQYRSHENDVPIDARGIFEGKAYADAIEFQKVLTATPSLTACVAQRVYEYGVGRAATASDRKWLEYLVQRFSDEDYRFAALMRIVATSKAFRAVAAPATQS